MSTPQGMARVDLMMLSGLGMRAEVAFTDGAAQITKVDTNGTMEYLFKDMGHAHHNIVHNIEVDEQALWADVGENPTTKVIEPYVHFCELSDLINDPGDSIRFILTDSHGNQEELHLSWVRFTDWSEPLI